MERSDRRSSWDVIGASVQGPYHKNKGIPNQDAIGWYQKKDGKLPIILAVADGVGDGQFFRSDSGSRFAVDASIETCKQHIRRIHRWDECQLRNRLVSEIRECWIRKIDEDLKNNPFSSDEEQISIKFVQHEFDETDQSTLIKIYPYSTTLNTVIITPEIIIMLQVGDGDIVIVRDDGSTREIFHQDLNCGRVFPLSYPNIEHNCHVCIKTFRTVRPLIVYVSSDGYSDGYDSMKVNFDEIVAYEFHSKIQEYGVIDIQEALPGLLEDLSQGSSDDLSLGIIVGPQKRIRETPLKLKTLCVQIEEVKEPASGEQGVEPTPTSSALNNGESGEKMAPSNDNSGINQDQ